MAFPAMRRAHQQLSEAQCTEILKNGSNGVLAVQGDDGFPYTVPLSFVLHDGNIYFHCATAGHKLRGIERSSKVSFCVVARDDVLAEKFTTVFSSVVVFGEAQQVTDGDELMGAMKALADKYCPHEPPQAFAREKAGSAGRLCVVRIRPLHITGKQAKELLQG
ncbi:MAG: pyridoxamine 5'-phosphate oxidase family protein [Oscillospiraceae bacterium]|nr:pyridoxamine 5'-phosphate oxidase family protein [Oscillospiraceae bacterium]